MKIELEQRSPLWHTWRSDKIGASEIGTIMGLNPYETALQWWERRKGLRAPKEMNEAMQRGVDLEPEALAWANNELVETFTPAVYQSDENPFMIASLDGINKDGTVIVEIKCSKKTYEAAQRGKIEEMYRAQVQQQLYCSGAVYAVFCAYYDGSGVVIRVDRDEDYIKRIIEAAILAKAVWLDKNEPPEGGHSDVDVDDHQVHIVKEYIAAVSRRKTAEEVEKKLKKQVQDMGDDGDCILIHEGDAVLKMTRVQPAARVDYDALCKAHSITEATIALYRKPEGIGFYKMTVIGEKDG